MTEQQFSKHFNPSTDSEYKNAEFERGLSEWIAGFVQCYPHVIHKQVVDDIEIWILSVMI